MTGVSLFLNQIPIFALLSLTGGAVLCALSGPYITPEACEKMTKVRKQNDTRNQTPYPRLS